jgi:hypothetical protein
MLNIFLFKILQTINRQVILFSILHNINYSSEKLHKYKELFKNKVLGLRGLCLTILKLKKITSKFEIQSYQQFY